MKSIKPGRGPSMMGGIASVIAVVVGIFWTVTATSMGAPFFFPLFGILFILIGAAQAIYNFKNATGKNRYSEFDIVDSKEEPDPLERRMRRGESEEARSVPMDRDDCGYCPYCGSRVSDEFDFCPKCGKRLPM